MSLFSKVSLSCPACGASISTEAARSINADRRPDLKDAILRNHLQTTTCDACSEIFRLQPEFSYVDTAAGLWIACYPATAIGAYATIEDDVGRMFATTYGSAAPKAAQDIGENLDVRMTFGWPALREKVLTRQAGLDDRVLELVKLDLLRRLPDAPLTAGVELRLTEVTEAKLRLIWTERETETVRQEIEADRALYQEVADHPDGWKSVRDQFAVGAFVDIQKLYLAPATQG